MCNQSRVCPGVPSIRNHQQNNEFEERIRSHFAGAGFETFSIAMVYQDDSAPWVPRGDVLQFRVAKEHRELGEFLTVILGATGQIEVFVRLTEMEPYLNEWHYQVLSDAMEIEGATYFEVSADRDSITPLPRDEFDEPYVPAYGFSSLEP